MPLLALVIIGWLLVTRGAVFKVGGSESVVIRAGEVDWVRDGEVGIKESCYTKGISLGQYKIGSEVSEDDLKRKSLPFDSQTEDPVNFNGDKGRTIVWKELKVVELENNS